MIDTVVIGDKQITTTTCSSFVCPFYYYYLSKKVAFWLTLPVAYACL